MTHALTPELFWLTCTLLMTALFWVPYILNRFAMRGVIKVLVDTGAETGATPTLWAQRALRAHENAVQNLVIFAPLVLIAHELDISIPITQIAAEIYFFARLLHFAVYVFGIPFGRTVTFLTGLAAQMVFVTAILGWM